MTIRFVCKDGTVIDAPATRKEIPAVRKELMKHSRMVYNLFAKK